MIAAIIILTAVLGLAILGFIGWAVLRTIRMAREDHEWVNGDHADPDPWVEDFEEGKT